MQDQEYDILKPNTIGRQIFLRWSSDLYAISVWKEVKKNGVMIKMLFTNDKQIYKKYPDCGVVKKQ